MKRALLLLIPLLLNACSLNEEKRQLLLQTSPPWYAEAGIALTIKTEPMLNAWKGMPNALSLVILQSRDRQSLESLITSEKEVRTLFSGAALPADILSIDRITAMPGQQTTLHLNRVENTRYLAVVAGYYPVPGIEQAVLVSIPMAVTRGWLGWKVEVGKLQLSLSFGERALVQIQGAENLLLSQKKQQEAPQ